MDDYSQRSDHFYRPALGRIRPQKTIDPQWHVFRTVPGSLITLERPCLTCGGFIFHTAKPASATPSSGLWVIEIALNTPNRHRATKAIKQLELPVARKENNFVVIGPYKQKQDAARVVKELSEVMALEDG